MKIAFTVLAAILALQTAVLGEVSLTGAGATFPKPLYEKWASEYAKAHDGKLPPAATWQDDIAPYYLIDKTGKKIPSVPILDFGNPSRDLGCAADAGSPATGMAFNSDLAGKTVTEAYKTPGQILLFEVPQTGRNIARPYKRPTGTTPLVMGKPRDWLTVPVSGNLNIGSDQSSTIGNNSMGNGL